MTESNTHEYQTTIMKSVFLLALAVSGNFVGSTLSCQLQNAMTNNVYVKHIILLFMIYFTLTSSVFNSDKKSPSYSLINTLVIWVCFVMFSRQNINFSILVILLLALAYISDQYLSYYKNEGNLENIKFAMDIKNLLFIGSGVVLLVGFAKYFIEKKCEYGQNFDYLNFIFGKPTCDSLK